MSVEAPERIASPGRGAAAMEVSPEELLRFLALNSAHDQHVLRPFSVEEFGSGPQRPTVAHVEAANRVIARLAAPARTASEQVLSAFGLYRSRPSQTLARDVLLARTRSDRWTELVERVWEFYLQAFTQRRSPVGPWLLAADRVALDCYETVWTHVASSRSVPTPGPFALMQTSSTPYTFRRGVRLQRTAGLQNPFPIVSVPYRRLAGPWTLGSIHHEVAHNLQADLGLWGEVPRRIHKKLIDEGVPRAVAQTWARWHKEAWADLAGTLLGGPAVVESLIDVVAKPLTAAVRISATGVHPPPYIRILLSARLLDQIGLPASAEVIRRRWTALYPSGRRNLPALFATTLDRCLDVVLEVIAFTRYRQLGGLRLVEVIPFRTPHLDMTREAAQRLAQGIDPGIVPARFMVGAVRGAVREFDVRPEIGALRFYEAMWQR